MRDDISVAVEVTSLLFSAKEFQSSWEDWTHPAAEYERLELFARLNALHLHEARHSMDPRVRGIMIAVSELLEDRYAPTQTAIIVNGCLRSAGARQ